MIGHLRSGIEPREPWSLNFYLNSQSLLGYFKPYLLFPKFHFLQLIKLIFTLNTQNSIYMFICQKYYRGNSSSKTVYEWRAQNVSLSFPFAYSLNFNWPFSGEYSDFPLNFFLNHFTLTKFYICRVYLFHVNLKIISTKWFTMLIL